jgi:hypothetical protein
MRRLTRLQKNRALFPSGKTTTVVGTNEEGDEEEAVRVEVEKNQTL